MITKEEVSKAEAKLQAAKKDRDKGPGQASAYRKQAKATADLRREWRLQEVAAGRRVEGIGVMVIKEDQQ